MNRKSKTLKCQCGRILKRRKPMKSCPSLHPFYCKVCRCSYDGDGWVWTSGFDSPRFSLKDGKLIHVPSNGRDSVEQSTSAGENPVPSPTLSETGEKEQCLACCGKHLGAAKALCNEGLQGHPDSYFTAIGNMSLAADHVLEHYRAFAALIRDQRLQLEKDAAFKPAWELMMNQIMRKMKAEGVAPKGF